MARFIGSGPATKGLGIGTVPDGSPFAGALQQGDVIDSINGEPYAKGMLSVSAKSLMAGEVPALIFGVTRGDQSLMIRVVRE
jgi:S1-C subfamily serine protease